MKSPPLPAAKSVLSLLEKYAQAQADLAKWSMLPRGADTGSDRCCWIGTKPGSEPVREEGGAGVREDCGRAREGAHEAERQPIAEGVGGEVRPDLEDGRRAPG